MKWLIFVMSGTVKLLKGVIFHVVSDIHKRSLHHLFDNLCGSKKKKDREQVTDKGMQPVAGQSDQMVRLLFQYLAVYL